MPRFTRLAISTAASLVALAAGVVPAASGSSTFPVLSQDANGTLGTYAISQDQRMAHLVAFSSNATNVVRGEGGAHFTIFLTRRAHPYDDQGEPWVPGGTIAPIHPRPNGDAVLPALSGGFYGDGDCLAFISNASNLPGGSNGQPQAYVEDLHTRHIRRVSVSNSGAPANGPVDSVSIDGACARVAFTARATNLTGGAPNPFQSAPAPAGVDEVYVHTLSANGFPATQENGGIVGRTFLASQNGRGVPANGDCTDVKLANFGANLAYSCTATNLAGTSNQSNVYTTELSSGFGSPHHRSIGDRRRVTRLVSVSSGGGEGDGPSDHAVIDAGGQYVTYHSTATNLFGGATGMGDVIRADVSSPRPGQTWVSRPFGDARPNGPSDHPTSTYPGDILLFDSAATNVTNPGRSTNRAPAVFFWSSVDRLVKLRSRPCVTCEPLSGAATNPVTSYVANYTLFRHGGQLWMIYIPK